MVFNYETRARAWFERAKKEDDEFVKFILFYISLEVSVKRSYRRIRDIKENTSLKEIFFNSVSIEKIVELKKVLDNEPLHNMNPNGDMRWSGKLESEEDFDGIIEFIIRARNNLFHGDKRFDARRDLFIVQWGNFLIEPLVGEILNGQ